MALPLATATTATTRLLADLQIPVEPKPQTNRITYRHGIAHHDRGVVLKGIKRLAESKGIQETGPDGLNSLGREKLLGLLQLILRKEEAGEVLQHSYGTLAAKLDCSETVVKRVLPIGRLLGLIQLDHFSRKDQMYSFRSGTALEPAAWLELLEQGQRERRSQIAWNTKEDSKTCDYKSWQVSRRRGGTKRYEQKPRTVTTPDPALLNPGSTGVLPRSSKPRCKDTPRSIQELPRNNHPYLEAPKEHLGAPRSNQAHQAEVQPQASALSGYGPAHTPVEQPKAEQPGQPAGNTKAPCLPVAEGVADQPGSSVRSLRSLPAEPGTDMNSQQPEQPQQPKLINGMSNPLNVQPGDTVYQGDTPLVVLNAFQWDTDDYWCCDVASGKTCWINASKLTV